MTNNRKIIGLDAIILFILVIYLMLNINSPFPYFYRLPQRFLIFDIITLILVFVYLILSLLENRQRENQRFFPEKLIIIIILIIFWVGITTIIQMVVRHHSVSPHHFLHDGAVQTEESIKFLLAGKNPYIENYQDTAFGNLPDVFSGGVLENPAWYHHLYLPFHLLFSVPFYILGQNIFGFYDQRLVYLFVFALSLWLIYKVAQSREQKLIGLTVFAFNPVFIKYLITGFNDIFVFFWIFLAVFLLSKNKILWAGISLALAFGSKQSAWLILPFFLAYLYFLESSGTIIAKIKTVFKKIIPFIIVSVLIFLPFLIWSFNDFIDDVIHYPSGSSKNSYPISGLGFSVLFLAANWISSDRAYFPFWILQLLVGLPLLYFLLRLQKRNNCLAQMMFGYGIFLLAVWSLARYLNDSHLGYFSLIFIVAYLLNSQNTSDVLKDT